MILHMYSYEVNYTYIYTFSEVKLYIGHSLL